MAANTWDKVISEWDQHCDEPVAAIRQRKNAERVEDGRQIGDGREQPVEVAFVDGEGDDSEMGAVSGARAELFERPLSGQPIVDPPILMCDRGQ